MQITNRNQLQIDLENYAGKFSQHAVVIDRQVDASYPFEFPKIYVPEGEDAKTLESASLIWDEMCRRNFDRHALLVAMGGGALSDVAGFAASTYMRGIATLYIPTTLMAMVDAAIGGKTAINFGQAKNRIGTFHMPTSVWICPEFLDTLPEAEIASGIAEMIKLAVVSDSDLFTQLENGVPIRDLILHCAQKKAEIVSLDPKDQGVRAILNWGHTFAHALEDISHFRRWRHGEAVAIGMSCAAYVSVYLGYADISFYLRQNELLKKYILPTILPDDIDLDALLCRMKQDKKALNGKIRLILARQIGTVLSVPDLDKDILKQALEAKRSSDR